MTCDPPPDLNRFTGKTVTQLLYAVKHLSSTMHPLDEAKCIAIDHISKVGEVSRLWILYHWECVAVPLPCHPVNRFFVCTCDFHVSTLAVTSLHADDQIGLLAASTDSP